MGLLDLECPFLQVIEQKQGLQFKKIVLLVISQIYLDLYVAMWKSFNGIEDNTCIVPKEKHYYDKLNLAMTFTTLLTFVFHIVIYNI